MAVTQNVILVLLSVFFATVPAWAQQPDRERIAEGKAAMNHGDCPAARRAFESVSANARDAAWLDLVAQASECTGDLRAALQYYEQEAAQIIASQRLTDKIGELRYQIDKQDETQRAAEGRNRARERATDLRRQQAQAEVQQRAEEKADALRTLKSDSRTLVSLVNDYQPDKTHYLKNFRASAVTSCQLQTEDSYGDGGRGHDVKTIDLSHADRNVSSDGNSVIMGCQQGSACVSLRSKNADDHDEVSDQFNFRTREEAQQAATLLKRVIIACTNP